MRVPRQVAPGSLAQVLDRSLMPRRLRVAEPDLGTDTRLQFAPVAELDPTVEGDRPTGGLGQGLHHRHETVHQMRRAPVIVPE